MTTTRPGAGLGVLLLAAGLAAASCAAPPPRHVDFSEGRRGFGPQDYERVLASWTRHQKVVQDVGTVIEIWATYKSWEWRQAYIERYARVYSLTDAERTALYTSELDASRATYEFHAAVQTTSYKWNDLEKETSPWRISLVDGNGAEISPKRIEVLRLPEIYETAFFPNRTEFTRSYAIRFNRADAVGFSGPATGRVTLRVASPIARSEVVWQSK